MYPTLSSFQLFTRKVLATSEFTNETPNGSTHYHQYAWRALIDSKFGHASFDLLSGFLTFVHMKSALFGSFFLFMSWLTYRGTVRTH